MKLLGTVRWGCSCGNASCGAAFASCPPSSPWLLGLLLISLADSKLLASRSRRAAASCRRCRRASARTSEGSREPVTWRACMLMACASRKKAAALLLRCATSSRDSSRTLAFECGRTPSASPGPRLEARRAAAGRPSSSPPWSSEGSGERPAGGRLTSRRETSRTTATFGRAPPKFLLTSAVSGETGENGSSSHSGLRVAMSNFARQSKSVSAASLCKVVDSRAKGWSWTKSLGEGSKPCPDLPRGLAPPRLCPEYCKLRADAGAGGGFANKACDLSSAEAAS
eukprot:CAMPEP_0115311390 /NCGR_PEP_ID=MMETSP0270-20121206/75308_1 /TAXON_ID=71861 /ORGANISM="Scrippsiella trochoidea, Strain CCMP3099" /LENGTH=282 /DNA_ID=CAMNT_0002730215 /DNA_START=240 /DNA_END=1085 /DNA_ORIENTATION=-